MGREPRGQGHYGPGNPGAGDKAQVCPHGGLEHGGLGFSGKADKTDGNTEVHQKMSKLAPPRPNPTPFGNPPYPHHLSTPINTSRGQSRPYFPTWSPPSRPTKEYKKWPAAQQNVESEVQETRIS